MKNIGKFKPFIWLKAKIVKSNYDYNIKMIEKKYEWLFTMMENPSFDQYLTLRKMEQFEISKLKCDI